MSVRLGFFSNADKRRSLPDWKRDYRFFRMYRFGDATAAPEMPRSKMQRKMEKWALVQGKGKNLGYMGAGILKFSSNELYKGLFLPDTSSNFYENFYKFFRVNAIEFHTQ